ncbi:MAG: flagellar biosynthesis protein FlgN [Spirochaetales bacterium]|nr:flagellar biosynthesis protein FlgN [Spirochaetales bacterium]
MPVLQETELAERVAILKRLRKHLTIQREKFRSYLDVLERQGSDIENEDTEKLQAHVELEKLIVNEIYAFQKVIDPLQDMYRAAYPAREAEIPAIQKSLDHLKEQVLERNKRNQNLLRKKMGHVRRKISDIRATRKLTTVMTPPPVPTLIDTTA